MPLVRILIILLTVIMASCTGRSGRTEVKQTDDPLPDMDQVRPAPFPGSGHEPRPMNMPLGQFYQIMSPIEIPLSLDAGITYAAAGFSLVPENLYPAFYNSMYFDPYTRAARLPDVNGFHLIAVFYNDGRSEEVIDLYTLSDSMRVVDRIEVYSVEETDGGSDVILRTGEIDDRFRIKVSKRRRGLLIEQLYFRVDNSGVFSEVRDGSVISVSFESDDDVFYTVESFIWEKKQRRALNRKVLTRNIYRMTADGKYEKVKKR